MPAEFKPHLGCILHYPHLSAVWRGIDGDCRFGKEAFRNVARAIAGEGQEDVHMFCTSSEAAEELRTDLESEGSIPNSRAISVHVAESDDSWCRDTGPTFVIDTSIINTPNLAGISWDFNAYGGQDHGIYWPCDKDRVLAERMTEKLAPIYQSQLPMVKLEKYDLVLEGGAIHTDGEGTILTTEECLLEGHRNPGITKEKYEEIFKEYLGTQKVIWLDKGLYMDSDTSGHIDNIVCFIRPGHVALAWPHDPNDEEQVKRSEDALRILEEATDAKGRKLTIHKLECPSPLHYTQEEVDTLGHREDIIPRKVGDRMAASYVNFYIGNNAIILPGFNDPNDVKAKHVLQELFPTKTVVQIYSREIILGGGNVHCITQQIPDPAQL